MPPNIMAVVMQGGNGRSGLWQRFLLLYVLGWRALETNH
jgi:hypothetical protein